MKFHDSRCLTLLQDYKQRINTTTVTSCGCSKNVISFRFYYEVRQFLFESLLCISPKERNISSGTPIGALVEAIFYSKMVTKKPAKSKNRSEEYSGKSGQVHFR